MNANKNILLFIPNGKGIYGTAIYKELNKNGFNVYIYNERPSRGTVSKMSIRMFKNKLEYYFINYIKKIIKNTCLIEFDYVVIIRAEAFTPNAMKLLRRAHYKAKFILYLWDSVSFTDTRDIFPFFDKILSFDKIDSLKYQLIHRPLFYIDDYCSQSITKQDIDILFIGTIHSDRYKFLKIIENKIKDLNLNYYYYMYFPSRLIYFKNRLTKSEFKLANNKEFKFKMITAKAASDLMQRCKVSIDAQHPMQSGLTMRTIEVLGAKKKLITTNKEIINYDFYNEQNIRVVDRANPHIDKSFISTPYVDIADEIYHKYSLKGWLEDVIVK